MLACMHRFIPVFGSLSSGLGGEHDSDLHACMSAMCVQPCIYTSQQQQQQQPQRQRNSSIAQRAHACVLRPISGRDHACDSWCAGCDRSAGMTWSSTEERHVLACVQRLVRDAVCVYVCVMSPCMYASCCMGGINVSPAYQAGGLKVVEVVLL
jgi:hypothetical protein